MKTIQLTKGKQAQVDDEDFDYLNQWKWHTHAHRNTFYARRSENLFGIKMVVYMHRDRNGLNCQENNLRIITNQQNQFNSGSSKNSTSKYKGVSFYLKRKKYRAQINMNAKNQFIGRFHSEIEAAEAYDEKAKIFHGEFASLNFK